MESRELVKTIAIIIAVVALGVLFAYILPKLGIVGRHVGPLGVYNLAQPAYGVQTNVGTVDLPTGTRIGGSPYLFISLIQDITLLTGEEGWHYFPVGTKIDCEHEAGEPDPCDPYSE